MATVADTLVVSVDDLAIGDIELLLLGVLPSGHTLGGQIATEHAPPAAAAEQSPATEQSPAAEQSPARARLALSADEVAQALARGRITLVDEELTPVASLTGVTLAEDGVVVGDLLRERVRESGAGGASRFAEGDLTTAYDVLVVVSRPPTADVRLEPAPAGSRVLLAVPDSAASTDHVPPALLARLAAGMAAHLAVDGAAVEVRFVPVRWRGASSDRALVDALARCVRASSVRVLAADPALDAGAAAWVRARAALDVATDDSPVPGLDAEVTAQLRGWRRPRPQRGVAMMFTGFSGSGKSTLARAVRDRLERDTTRTVSILDGDVVRRLLSSGLGFDRQSRILNVRRIGYVAAEVARHGGLAICAPIAPYASTRADVRGMVEAVGDFILIHVSTSLEECERRDLKGLYAAARAGRIPEFTGISDPYDVPTDADLSIDTAAVTVAEGVEQVMRYLADGGWVTLSG